MKLTSVAEEPDGYKAHFQLFVSYFACNGVLLMTAASSTSRPRIEQRERDERRGTGSLVVIFTLGCYCFSMACTVGLFDMDYSALIVCALINRKGHFLGSHAYIQTLHRTVSECWLNSKIGVFCVCVLSIKSQYIRLS